MKSNLTKNTSYRALSKTLILDMSCNQSNTLAY